MLLLLPFYAVAPANRPLTSHLPPTFKFLHYLCTACGTPGPSGIRHHPSNLYPRRPPNNMAKGNLFLGAARGKVGSLVFKRQNGEQVTAPRVTPANPRTTAQMMQRLALSSASKTAAALDEIISHSYQGIAYGEKSRQAFIKEASKLFAASIKRADDGQYFGTCAAIPVGAHNCGGLVAVTLSKGDLDSPAQKILKASGSLAQISGVPYIGDLSSMAGGAAVDIDLSNYETVFGVPVSDQLTFVLATAVDAVGYPAGVRAVEYTIRRLNWKQDLAEGTKLFVYDSDGDEYIINASAVDTDRSSADIVACLSGIVPDVTTVKAIDVSGVFRTMDAGEYCCGFAVIASRFVDGVWKRSTQKLMVKPQISAQSTNTAIKNGWGYNDLYYLLEDANPSQRVVEDRYLNKEKN